jgi:hypothetical protein
MLSVPSTRLTRGPHCTDGVNGTSSPRHTYADQTSALAEMYLGIAAIGSQWVQPLRHGDPIDVWIG